MASRILVVDDSALMRKILSDVISQDEELDVCATARDGKEAVQKAKELSPDLITMDIEMPELDGISAMHEILRDSKIPVIMVSAFTEKGSEKTLEAMDKGAIDFVLKPGDLRDEAIMDLLQKELIGKIKSALRAKFVRFVKHEKIEHTFASTRKKIILIGSSTGGPRTLESLLVDIPKNIPSPILIVQHMPPLFTKSLASRLDAACEIEVREAKDGDTLKDGVAYIAPGDFHMELKADFAGHEGVIRLNQEPKQQGVRPCVNVLFKSVAPIFRENVVAVVLTGMGQDGKEGSRDIKKYKGTVIAQSEQTCVIYGMPKAVVEENLADEVLDLDLIPVSLVQLIGV